MKRTTILTMSALAASAAILTACGGAAEAPAEEEVVEAEPLADACPDRVQDMRGSEDSFTCSCSAETAETGSVWGAGPYSDDSAVCRAAMHAGLVGDEPANVTITFLPGRDSYSAATANGVETRRWGSWGGSFFFEGAEAGEPEEEVAAVEACPANARDLRGTGETVTCGCDAAASASGSVWGSETYTDDSRICRAAVHAGVIEADGGEVTFTVVDGLSSYSGSEANGVTTRDYGTWSGSFEFQTDEG
ncbi:LCCL domain-containing protein [Parasphingopyxis marina]|uniref:LCCL domain-containing protein n=1 Tax=Parasphingopyxis marina TaxID=2761622 RepID=UPI001C8D19B2|nr:LCCL domain-containing protein [Parasphingopyxis marina]